MTGDASSCIGGWINVSQLSSWVPALLTLPVCVGDGALAYLTGREASDDTGPDSLSSSVVRLEVD